MVFDEHFEFFCGSLLSIAQCPSFHRAVKIRNFCEAVFETWWWSKLFVEGANSNFSVAWVYGVANAIPVFGY
jgi:hypothetical protein